MDTAISRALAVCFSIALNPDCFWRYFSVMMPLSRSTWAGTRSNATVSSLNHTLSLGYSDPPSLATMPLTPQCTYTYDLSRPLNPHIPCHARTFCLSTLHVNQFRVFSPSPPYISLETFFSISLRLDFAPQLTQLGRHRAVVLS